MSDQTTIEWTDATFNPWWGCTKVSPGCDHCYAERDAKRYAAGTVLWGDGSERRTFGEKHWQQPVTWNARAAKADKRMRVFCASMADVFDKDAPVGVREMLWALIERTPHLDWQLLTKRIGNVSRMVPATWISDEFPSNVWMMISVVNQPEADRDVTKLLALPAHVRGLSIEPLLGAIRLHPTWLHSGGVDWVIAGGESGPHARPMHPDWVRSIRDQCAAAGVPFLFKQWGEWADHDQSGVDMLGTASSPLHAWRDHRTSVRIGKKAAGRMLDGVTHDGYPAARPADE